MQEDEPVDADVFVGALFENQSSLDRLLGLNEMYHIEEDLMMANVVSQYCSLNVKHRGTYANLQK